MGWWAGAGLPVNGSWGSSVACLGFLWGRARGSERLAGKGTFPTAHLTCCAHTHTHTNSKTGGCKEKAACTTTYLKNYLSGGIPSLSSLPFLHKSFKGVWHSHFGTWHGVCNSHLYASLSHPCLDILPHQKWKKNMSQSLGAG